MMKACNVAVFTWAIVGCGSYQYCQYRRHKEKEGMQMARDLMEQKRATIEAKKEARRKAREQQEAEEARRLEEERKKSWTHKLKFW
jgi:cytochrome c oxidase assembly protein subunit 20